mgnify:CR=1 FL=1
MSEHVKDKENKEDKRNKKLDALIKDKNLISSIYKNLLPAMRCYDRVTIAFTVEEKGANALLVTKPDNYMKIVDGFKEKYDAYDVKTEIICLFVDLPNFTVVIYKIDELLKAS